MLREQILNNIRKTIGYKEVELEKTANPMYGDYFTNLALKLKKNPQKIAKNIKSPLFKKVEVAGPGFVNFYLSENYLLSQLEKALTNPSRYLLSAKSSFSGKKIAIEFTDPNPFKEFHLGHLYTNIVGDAIARILEAGGARVKRVNYQGDVGLHVAKAVWGICKLIERNKTSMAQLEKKTLDERLKLLGLAYVFGSNAYEADESSKKEILQINKKIFSLKKDIKEIYIKGRKWSLKYFERIYKRLGTKFDFYYFEQDTGSVGLEIVKKNLKKGIFEESQGAIIFPGDKYGFHKRVFVNSDGLPTYEAKELGLALLKYKDFRYDLSLIITANEVVDYFKVVLLALKAIYPKLAQRTIHIPHGVVRLKTGKMSSRKGNIVRAEDFLEKVKDEVRKKTPSDLLAEKIMLGAVKYYFLKVGLGKDIIFDISASLDTTGDSGVYLQYTYTRFKSILNKISSSYKNKIRETSDYFSKLNMSSVERYLIVEILRFQETLKDAADSFSPNKLTNYLHSLCTIANEFYHSYSILKEEDTAKKILRINLAKALITVLERGLNLLGISPVEKM